MGERYRPFWSKVKKGPDCWEWQGALNEHGYGQVSIKAHRLAYILTHGKEPEGDVLHSCDNTICVNPDHLWDGTPAENLQQARDSGRLVPHNSLKTHCSRGHPFDEENTIFYRRRTGCLARKCKECNNQQAAERRQRAKYRNGSSAWRNNYRLED